MLDRQDIDALLIGRLYGELTDADEARLNAHLDSHPADKSALVGLTSARNAVRESRFLTVQLEPPQAISALLLQEASRRAPAKVVANDAKKESWFARFVASFARHPAMAAAAMMVLVAGVAGTLYLKGGKSQFADQSTKTFATNEKAAAEAPAPSAAAPAIEPDRDTLEEARALQKQAGSSFEASLADGAAGEARKDFKAKEDNAEAARNSDAVAKTEPAPAKPTNRTYIGVPSERPPQPKDLENEVATIVANDDGDGRRGKGGAAAPGAVAPADQRRREPVVASPSPPPPPTRAPTTVPRGAGAGGEDALRQEQKLSDEETSWAREQAVKVTNAVKANNCKDAASLAVQLSTRNPAFYKDNVENDRDLKKCITYINAAREKEAEQQRVKNLKRNAEEANPRRAAPTTNSK